MCKTRHKLASLAALIFLSACASNDPIMLLPPVERGYLKTLIKQEDSAAQQPISVSEMLNKARGTVGPDASQATLAAKPPVVELRFHPDERAVSERHFADLEGFRNGVANCEGCKINIEVPSYRPDPLLHYQRAISAAKRLNHQTSSINIRIKQKQPPHILKLKISAGAS